MKYTTSKRDVIWNYVGTLVSMGSGILLLPMLIRYLSDIDLGLWYVYIAIANLATLFEFGFDPTFARNIVYVLTGSTKLVSTGIEAGGRSGGKVDWHLLNVVITASKIVYAVIAIATLVLLITVGSAYIVFILPDVFESGLWVSWAVFCISIFLNLYFLWSLTVLRGYGDIAGENRARTYGKIAQLISSAVLLVLGFGIIGASVGFLANSVTLRVCSLWLLKKHREILQGRRSDELKVSKREVINILKTISHIAWRDGVVSISNYAATQAISILCSIFLGLAATGIYSVSLQIANALVNFASAYPKSFLPMLQSEVACDNLDKQRSIVAKGVVMYWLLYCLGVFASALALPYVIPIIKPGTSIDLPLFLGLCVYLGLWNQHSIFCSYIVSRNELPYMPSFVISSLAGITLSCACCGLFNMGAWGIVLGQGLAQLVYNNWKWPSYLCFELGIKYTSLLLMGARSLTESNKAG